MKFTILQSEFAKALNISGKSLLTKTNLPILSNILIKAEDSKLEVVSTDLETATRAIVKTKVGAEGEITVAGRTLSEFISQLPEGEVVFEKLGGEVVVSTKGYNARLATMPPEEFPAIPKIEKGITIEFEAPDFVRGVIRVAFSAAQDEGRPVLTGVLGEINKNKLAMVATDGYRLGFAEINLGKTTGVPSLKMIIPAKAVSEVAKILADMGMIDGAGQAEKSRDKIKMVVGEALNQVNFRIGDLAKEGVEVEFTSRLIEGEFPNWQKIIPSVFNTKVIIDRQDFIRLVRIASIFARDSGNIVRLKLEGDKNGKKGVFTVNAASSQVGSSDASCEVGLTGKGGEIAFNFRYLLEILSVVEDELITFEMNESLNPGRITGQDAKDNFFHIIMPVRLQS
ncbi:DNA polymerase III subunit beta [Candidatus Curtissbacteria bacterium RIFCSPLOWO2_01_FULL_41_18]|uniref:Beta sliding clamp n=1 Tax=Candidatus Curtissbacteria bacterium RIFCSPLOWO2_01_FULL_41_18 TaxID=1797727 RepID=A0A1F5HJY8_9BACT|nr:MAG: DNA polymerase III subunit beta [Candidatus Curtissbacteria bacterium RIFCSPLOWO2_01_FULL_41_18]